MIKELCECCGGNSFSIKNGYRICDFCGTKFQITKDEMPIKESNIDLDDDVQRLLEKCRLNPARARQYANLILDIDPYNVEAKRFL